MREGFYKFEFLGATGLGFGMFVLDTGMVVGADIAGGKYDGKFAWNTRTECIEIDVAVQIPEGVQTVQGVIAGSGGLRFQARCSFPRKPDNVEVEAETDLGPALVRIHQIREFPD